MTSEPFAEEAEISVLKDPEVDVELVDQGTTIPIRRQADMKKFHAARHGRRIAKYEGEMEGGRGGGRASFKIWGRLDSGSPTTPFRPGLNPDGANNTYKYDRCPAHGSG
jgi:hypothetical protein